MASPKQAGRLYKNGVKNGVRFTSIRAQDLVGRNPRSGFRRMSFWPSFDPHSAESRLAVPPYVIRRYVSPQ